MFQVNVKHTTLSSFRLRILKLSECLIDYTNMLLKRARAMRAHMCILILKNFLNQDVCFFVIVYFTSSKYCTVDFRKENTRVADDIWEGFLVQAKLQAATL